MSSATLKSLKADVAALGLRPGDLVMIHASMRSVGSVIGGATTLIQAVLDQLGPEGTLCAYLDFEPFYEDGDDPESVPVFDKRTARAARDHGIVHEVLRTWPGTLRSDHPDAGVGALGRLAEWLTMEHAFQYGYGPGSPFERVVEARGRVLMIGAPLDTISLLHYAEHLAQIPDKRIVRYRRKMIVPPDPEPKWVDFEEFDTSEPVNSNLPSDSFEQIGRAALAAGLGTTGRVGAATAHLFDGPALVEFAVRWLEATVNRPVRS